MQQGGPVVIYSSLQLTAKEATLPPGPDQAQESLITDLEAIDNSQIKKRTDWARFPTLPKKRQRCQPHDICGTYHFK